MKSYSLFELNQFIRRVIALNLSDAIWIQCEIGQCNESRGHYWLELVQKGEENEDDIIAQASAVIWSRQYRKLRKELGKNFEQLLREGMEVKVKAKVDFNERFGMKLMIESIDPSYTLGKLALQRQRILEQLKTEELLNKNVHAPIATVLQSIAVISSAKAAGYQDFVAQLSNNAYGYKYQVQFFPSAMQGAAVEEELLQQLKKIKRSAKQFDAVVIIRGGGSKLDLQAFDNYNLGKAVAEMPLPVFVGIGHDIDKTVLDTVAFSSLKTPTAVADFLIHYNEQFEVKIQQLALSLQQLTYVHLKSESLEVERLSQIIQLEAQRFIEHEKAQVENMKQQLKIMGQIPIHIARQQLNAIASQVDLYNPLKALERGFVQVTNAQGDLIKSKQSVHPEDLVNLHFSDGTVKAKIEEDE